MSRLISAVCVSAALVACGADTGGERSSDAGAAIDSGAMEGYALREINVPLVVFGEYEGMTNPHFDSNGGDVYGTIDPDYHASIARIAATYAAKLAVLE